MTLDNSLQGNRYPCLDLLLGLEDIRRHQQIKPHQSGRVGLACPRGPRRSRVLDISCTKGGEGCYRSRGVVFGKPL